MKLIKDFNICALSIEGIDHIKYFKEVLQAGVDIIQLRDKTISDRIFYDIALELKKIAKDFGKIFIINDRIDVALAVNSDGVHIGCGDLPIQAARSLLGEEKIIGYSCHNRKDAQLAKKNEVDYISIGPVFRTATKKNLEPINRDEIKLIMQEVNLPFFAIGGINVSNVNKIQDLGFKNIACLSAFVYAEDKKDVLTSLRKVIKNDIN